MSIDNQKGYWDSISKQKTFTHPININLLLQYVNKKAAIVDYGCGYGRIVNELIEKGFTHTIGFDTSIEFIKMGKLHQLPISYIPTPADLPMEVNRVDCFLLFAVLTCIPSNHGQTSLINLLKSKLKSGGFIYISDYYLQDNGISKSRYTYFNNEEDNFGVFTLPEGVTFRHHTKDWIASLVKDFKIKEEMIIEVKTMNGNIGKAFQMILQK